MDTLEFFLLHHGRLHSGTERVLFDELTKEQMRFRYREDVNSIAWLVWHMARCEDIMNVIIADRPQVLSEGAWLSRFNLSQHEIGTGMSDDEVGDFSTVIDLDVLRDYYRAVGENTQAMVRRLSPNELDEVPDSAQLSRSLAADGSVRETVIDWLIWEREGNDKGWWLGHLGLTHNYLHRGEGMIVRGLQGVRGRSVPASPA